MSPQRTLSLAVLVATLSACSGGGGDGGDDAFGGINCAGLTGATATASNVCNGTCNAPATAAAADGDLNTYAILDATAQTSGTLRIRATAQDGVSYPAGTPAAVVYGIVRGGGTSLNTAETISTYLDGVLQETGTANTGFGSTNEDVAGGRRAIVTNTAFDAIELSYAQSGGTADVEVRIYEFCTSVN
jgi:hypothetical protein